MIKGVPGVPDILPAEIKKWQYLEARAKKLLENYGYAEIRTPVFERTELFVRGIGPDTDIVEKEMYTFLDRRQESLTLRPEGTAPIIRAFLQHKMYTKGTLVKVYYTGPMFRYERPQAGRFRQFHQIGAEAIGLENPSLDAEVIAMVDHLFLDLSIDSVKLYINSVGCKACRPEFKRRFTVYLEPRVGKLCADCQARLRRNPLRIMDCKNESCQEVIARAPKLSAVLCDPCSSHFRQVQSALSFLKVEFAVNERLIRGLDYYNRTAFEFINPSLGSQNALVGGGRYDGLAEEIDGVSSPAIGFALGMERTLASLSSTTQDASFPAEGTFIATLGDEAFRSGMLISQELRKKGQRTALDFEGRSLKGQMRLANKERYRYCVIIGDEELKKRSVILKDMASAEQSEVPISRVVDRILSITETKGVPAG
jgi:histidyl-tRNA synthetase